MGARAPPRHVGGGNLKSSWPPSPGRALTTCKCARLFVGWPEWSFSSYLLFYLAALLIKTISDSCHVLSAGWLAAVFWPSAERLGRRKVLAGFGGSFQLQEPLLGAGGGAALPAPPFSGISVKAEEIKWPVSPVSHAGCWPALWVIRFMSIILPDFLFFFFSPGLLIFS